jgi:hypothetical protein
MTSTPGQQDRDGLPAAGDGLRLSADLQSVFDEFCRQARSVQDRGLARLADQGEKLDRTRRELDAAQAGLAELAADIGRHTRRRRLLLFWAWRPRAFRD